MTYPNQLWSYDRQITVVFVHEFLHLTDAVLFQGLKTATTLQYRHKQHSSRPHIRNYTTFYRISQQFFFSVCQKLLPIRVNMTANGKPDEGQMRN